jgi:2-succinyl-5-enolpyruvyl-6-hydroxy-3-cyclohexene-1-carboxylate synthase
VTIDFRNTNTLWASILVETLSRLGLTTVVVCPGSRSTPLTIAFARHPNLDVVPILDERSASFFALGVAKRIKFPVALVCTSGTAGANFYSAIIEAKEAQIPLIVITADRPPELRHCHAGQTIDQVKLYGNYPNWHIELAMPSAEIEMLRYLRQNTIVAWERSLFPQPGIVHINISFREPLAPISQPEIRNLESQFPKEEFFKARFPTPYTQLLYGRMAIRTADEVARKSPEAEYKPRHNRLPYDSRLFIETFQSYDRGIIIAGLAQSQDPQKYCQAIADLSKFFNFPVLVEGLSPLRNYSQLNPYLISTYDLILRDSQLADKLTPDLVIQIGELPTSKELRSWLNNDIIERWIIDPSNENFDPLHTRTIHLRTSIEQLSFDLSQDRTSNVGTSLHSETIPNNSYCQHWCELEKKTRKAIDLTLESTDTLHEGKAAWLLSRYLPEKTPIFIANSMSVRYVEFFWKPGDRKIVPYFSRGTNGIDGNLSTALGIAHRNRSTVFLTGDLALLHDTNGFLSSKKFAGHLTIILINNNGGGIFENLPIAQFDPPFEEFFATPQNIDFAKLCATYDVEYQLINNWTHLQELLNPLPDIGVRVLELSTDRKADTLWLQNTFQKLLKELKKIQLL